MRPERPGRRGEEGSALIIALIFLTTIAVVVASILSFTDVGLKASNKYDFKQRASTSYAAEGGIATAIKRYSSTGPCDNFSAPRIGPTTAPGTAVNGEGMIVRCDGPPPAGSRATQPVNSLLSLGSGANGIRSTGELRLLGDAFSRTTVSTDPGAAMVVQGEVSAIGNCTGPIQTAPPSPLRCANTSPPPPEPADPTRGRDPDYNPAVVAVPVRRTVPACPAGWLVALEPGYYDDAEALNRLTASPSTCTGKVIWFLPGAYYFDLGFRGGATTWTVDDPSVVVVGGEPKDWNPASPTVPSIRVPGGCKADGDGPVGSFGGVQIVAGGDTRLDLKKGRVELCATPSTTDQQLALFGLGPELAADVHALEASDISGAGFTSALDAQTIGEVPLRAAEATITDMAAPTASLDFGAFSPGVPSGSVIDTVTLRIKHQEDPGAPGDVGPITVTADFAGSLCGPSNPIAPQLLTPSIGTYREDTIDLVLTCGLAKPADLADLAVTYTVERASGGSSAPLSAKVDGVSVEVQYQTPITRKPTAVVGMPGFSSPVDALEIGEPPRALVNGMRVNPPAPLPVPEATLTAGSSASIELAGFADPPLPAPTTTRVSAVLRVAHRDQGANAVVTFPFRTGVCSLPLPQRADLTDDRVNLADCPPSGSTITRADVNGLTSATFSATLTAGGPATVQLDGLWLEVADGASAPARAPATRRASTATSVGFAPAESAKVIGEQPTALAAVANLVGGTDSASLQLQGFNRIPVAPGSRIGSIKLRVAHLEDAGIASVAALTGPLPGYPAGCPLTIPTTLVPGLPVTEVDLRAQCPLAPLDTLAQLDAVTYTATRKTETARLTPAMATEPVAFVNELDGRAIDGKVANAPLQNGAQPASLRLAGYSLTPPPPAGSTFDSATLRIVHREKGEITNGVKADVKFTDKLAACPTGPQEVTTRNGDTLVEDTIDLRACGLSNPGQLAGLTVSYQVTGAAPTDEAFLDGVVLDLSYRPPATDLLDGVELVIQSEPPRLRDLCRGVTTACDLLKVTPHVADPAIPGDVTDVTTRFVAAGTIYAPSAGVDISMYGLDHPVLKRGLVARNIKLGLRPLGGFQRPTGVIPPELVTFTAYPDRTLAPTVVTTTGFTEADNAKVFREQPMATAKATLPTRAATSASIDLSGYQADLPNGAVIDSAVLRVRHKDIGNTVSVTVKAGTTTCVVRDLASSPTEMSEDQIDLVQNVGAFAPACKLDKKSKLAAVTVTYTVALATTATMATAELDGITLEVLSGPLVRADVTFERDKAEVKSYRVLV